MAVKKSELYSMLWEACNKLRGGVEPSRYKDYVLVLLFFKYVSDRYKGQRFAEFTVNEGASFDDLIAAKGKPDVGERVDKIIQKFLEDNRLHRVLEELGSPMNLANEYNPQKRYLIGPGYFNKYIGILKVVVGICIVVFASISMVDSIINRYGMDLIDRIVGIFTNVLTGALVGTMQGAFWVTLIFIILERSGVEPGYLPAFSSEWTPDLLPEIPLNNNLKISRGETIFSILSTITFTALLYFQPQLIAIYIRDKNNTLNITSLFDINRLEIYIVFILILAVFQLGIFVWKYITKRWTMPLIILNALYNILMCILLIIMLFDNQLFNINFISAFSNLVNGSIEAITVWLDRARWIFVTFFIGITTWDSIRIFYKFKVYK